VIPLLAGAVVPLVLLLGRPAPASDGWEFLAKGKPGFARTAFTNQLKRTPDDARALVGLGLSELALGNSDKACELLLDAIKKSPEDRDAHLGLAKSFLLRARRRIATGRGEEDETRYFLLDAANQAERAAALKEDDPDAWVVVTEARLELGKFEEAERSIAEAEKRGIDAALKRRLRGELSYFMVASQAAEGTEESFREAKAALEALIHEDPGAAELRLRLGDLNHAFGHWNEALESWERGLAIEPFDRAILDTILTYLRVPELRVRARAVLELAAATAEKLAGGNDPRPAYAIMCVGHCRLLERDLDGATALFKKAKKLDPTLEVQCSLGLADADYRSQRYDDAAAAWKAAFHADHDSAKALVLQIGQGANLSASLQFLARQARAKSKNDEARELLAIAVELEAENAALWNDYAFLCRETGKADKAWEAYSKTIELAPDNPRYLNDAALILQDYLKKDFARARQLYERAIAAADALLADTTKPSVVRDAAADARKDATANLARLPSK
jgi:tetratricopeptide (TPR) repeat protein